MTLSKDKGDKIKVTVASGKTQEPEPVPAEESVEAKEQQAEQPTEAQDYYERLLRCMAEMDNLKKRQEKEKSELLQFANENLIKELLPIVDNLERALEHGRQLDAPAPLMEGLDLVHQSFIKALTRFGVTPIECVGAVFDPAFHNAVMQEESTEVPDCTIMKELQKGYLLQHRLLRPAMVVVAKNDQKTTCPIDVKV
ncbi:MAG: nucleotide exchange factor GrpE [Syntrophales bacterium]|nr:nucleotide exchange factor GrpE [Syntrophales bacterium]MDD5640785.1 nucleotide exchange factor GrpE [Syntrophales bacterium]